jgi:hypothetical protein
MDMGARSSASSGEILVDGTRRLTRVPIGMGLVVELRLLVYPVVLGAGGRLFRETRDKIALRLVESGRRGEHVSASATVDDVLRTRHVNSRLRARIETTTISGHVREVRVQTAPAIRESRSRADVRPSNGETRTRTGDTTIFSRAVESS